MLIQNTPDHFGRLGVFHDRKQSIEKGCESMKIHHMAEKVAAYLVASAEFCEHGYTVVSGARVKDVLLNGAALRGNQTVDLLVCEGNRVLVGIACRPETAKLFNLNMRGLSYVQIPEVDTALPLSADDDGWMDFPSEACLESLLKSVMLSLSCVRYREAQWKRKSLASYRKRALEPQTDKAQKPGGKIYTLFAMPPEQIMDKKPRNARNLYKKMAAKQLLRSDFTPTPYGNAHGLFLRYHVDPFGEVFSELLTVPGAVEGIRAVLSWKPEQTAETKKIPLAERTKRIHNLPVMGEHSILAAVKDLLDTPVDILFPNRTEDLQRLLNTMNSSRFLLNGGNPNDPAGSVPVYWEVLQTIHSLRQGFSDDPLLDDDGSRRMRRSCETLLLLLSEVFLTPRKDAEAAVPKDKAFVKKQSLKERLADVHSQSVFELFGISIASYYQTISRLSECDYPNWVYRSRILPILEDSGEPETGFNLRFLAAYCKVCLEDNGAHDWKEAFPLLLDLITIPVCIKCNL